MSILGKEADNEQAAGAKGKEGTGSGEVGSDY